MSEIRWHRDPAASGWRERAFMDDDWQLVAYDDGAWSIRKNNEVRIGGHEPNAGAGRARAIAVHQALTMPISQYTCAFCKETTPKRLWGPGWITCPSCRKPVRSVAERRSDALSESGD